MKKIIVLLMVLISSDTLSDINANANSSQIDSIKEVLTRVQNDVSHQKSRIGQLEYGQKFATDRVTNLFDSMVVVTTQMQNDLVITQKQFDTDLKHTQNELTESNTKFSERFTSQMFLGIVGLFFALLVCIVTYVLLRNKLRRNYATIERVRKLQDEIQKESLSLDNKLIDIISKQIEISEQAPAVKETDHSLVLSIAGEIARIEQNLAFMDPKVRGVSNLRNRASAIKASLKSKGYEIPYLVGDAYIEESNFNVSSFEFDENLEEGKKIIKRVVKPLVLFNGKAIQMATVVIAINE